MGKKGFRARFRAMKKYNKKIIFGFILGISFAIINIFLLSLPNASEMWIAIFAVFAFIGGVIFWMVQLTRERKENREENFRRKNQ